MKKSKTILALFGLTLFLSSCGGGNKDKESSPSADSSTVATTSTESSSATTMTAFDFLTKLNTDNFFGKENIGKEFILTDALVWNYSTADGKLILCGFNPNTMEYVGINKLDSKFEGKDVKRINVDDSTSYKYHTIHALLIDPKSMQSLKMYNSSKAANFAIEDSTVNDERTISRNIFKDKVTIKGTLKELSSETVHLVTFENCSLQ